MLAWTSGLKSLSVRVWCSDITFVLQIQRLSPWEVRGFTLGHSLFFLQLVLVADLGLLCSAFICSSVFFHNAVPFPNGHVPLGPRSGPALFYSISTADCNVGEMEFDSLGCGNENLWGKRRARVLVFESREPLIPGIQLLLSLSPLCEIFVFDYLIIIPWALHIYLLKHLSAAALT